MVKLAIIYDFDQTLCTKNMQEYSLLPSLDIQPASFWQEVNVISQKNNMDPILAYMYLLITEAKKHGKYLTRDNLNDLGNDIEYFPGVKEYFQRINDYGKKHDILIQHYIISSGTLEIIEGCSIYPYFTKVYGCQFHYDENGNADWPANAINYTGKTQFLFRINKNSLEVYDNSTINIASTTRDIPFNHMIYIADGFTDVPCMKLVKDKGGYAIAVYNQNEATYQQLVKDKRVNYVAKADYRENSELDSIIKAIIDKIAVDIRLERYKK